MQTITLYHFDCFCFPNHNYSTIWCKSFTFKIYTNFFDSNFPRFRFCRLFCDWFSYIHYWFYYNKY